MVKKRIITGLFGVLLLASIVMNIVLGVENANHERQIAWTHLEMAQNRRKEILDDLLYAQTFNFLTIVLEQKEAVRFIVQ